MHTNDDDGMLSIRLLFAPRKKKKSLQAVKTTPHVGLRVRKPLWYGVPYNSFTSRQKMTL
jgi:hypothetical protein